MFGLFVCWSLTDYISVFRSLPLAVWHQSWGRVTCSSRAWQSASPSRPAASICWPLTANRLDWKRNGFSPLLLFSEFFFFVVGFFIFGRFVADCQKFGSESEVLSVVSAVLLLGLCFILHPECDWKCTLPGGEVDLFFFTTQGLHSLAVLKCHVLKH